MIYRTISLRKNGYEFRYQIHGDEESGFRIYSLDVGRYILGGRYTHYLTANDALMRWFRRWEGP
jgi:hypothetical protein